MCLHVIKHSICFVSVKCSGPVLPYSAFIFAFSDTSVPFLYSQKVSKETWCFSRKNQEPVFLSLEDIKNSVNQWLTCKSSYSVLAAQAEFTITSLWRSRSFLHLAMKVFPSCEQRAGIPENVIIFHQRGKEPNVFAFSLNRLISVIAFVFIINFSLWSVVNKLKPIYCCILQCCSSLLQVFAMWRSCVIADSKTFIFFLPCWATQCCCSWCHITWLQPSLLFSREGAILSPR